MENRPIMETLSASRINHIVEQHGLWLESGEKEGQRADLSGAILNGVDLSSANLRGAFMRGASLDGARLRGADLIHADLQDAQLHNADLRGANLLLADFTGAALKGADLRDTTNPDDVTELGHVRRGPRFKEANLENADMRGAFCYGSDFSSANLLGTNFRGALLQEANLSSLNMRELNFENADLSWAKLSDSDLTGANLTGANLSSADLESAKLTEAKITQANLQSANLQDTEVSGIEYDRSTLFRGIRVATCYGSSRFRRFAQDQDYIEELKQASPLAYRLWWIMTDCGRSMLRVVTWSLTFTVLFGLGYYLLGRDAFSIANVEGIGWSFFTTLYYSLVTFTTLGFGDITPNTKLAATIVMAEVVIGYVMLGILISILANKVARRS